MLDPKFANFFIRMRQRGTVGRFRMRKTRWIEVEAEAVLLRPRNPVGKILRLDGVAVYFFAAELAVERVQVQTVFAGNERISFFQIRA